MWECNGTKFNVGDEVEVYKITPSYAKNGMGDLVWQNNWSLTMNDSLGTTGIIESISISGARLKPCSGYYWPLLSLKKLKPDEFKLKAFQRVFTKRGKMLDSNDWKVVLPDANGVLKLYNPSYAYLPVEANMDYISQVFDPPSDASQLYTVGAKGKMLWHEDGMELVLAEEKINEAIKCLQEAKDYKASLLTNKGV